ncbi:MAG: deaminase [Patescibacteria group bacterium]
MKIAALLYMPVLHQGFIKFLKDGGEKIDTIFLISEKTVYSFDAELASLFEKDLRAVAASEMKIAISALGLGKKVEILDEKNLHGYDSVVIPEDDIVERVLTGLYPLIVPVKKTWFLRWDKKTVLSERAVIANATISLEKFDSEVMVKAFKVAEKSSDWWRQVAAIIFPTQGEPIVSFNHHLPHEQAAYIFGDPRSVSKPGEDIHLSTAIHAEAGAIAYAARRGISLEGACIYVNTFPCPPCAWIIRESGIKTVYYCEGYSLLTAAEVFQSAGILLVFVNVPK